MLNESNAKNVQCVASICREQKVCAHISAPIGSGLVSDRKGAGEGYLTQRSFLLFSNMTFSALWVWTLSLGVEVTDPTPDLLRSGTRPDPTGAGMLHSE